MPRLRWRLYYGDHSTFDGEWMDAAGLNVVGLLVPSDAGGTYIYHSDFYAWAPWAKFPWGTDQWGVLDILLKKGVIRPDQPISTVSLQDLWDAGVKLGRSYDNDQWRELYALMKNDPDFPRKSNPLAGERPV